MDAVELPENLGIPGGHNAGVERLRELGGIDVLVVLYDDGLLPNTDTFRLIQEQSRTTRAWSSAASRSRTRSGSPSADTPPRCLRPDLSGEVTIFLGGGHAIRMSVIDRVGLFPTLFFYAHEETDFAWRALDVDWQIDYRADMVLQHPRTTRPAKPPTTAWPPATGSGWPSAFSPHPWRRSTSPSGRCCVASAPRSGAAERRRPV
ncbi:glycosyltransferase family 2 protein [Kitasatospora sp. NPDC057198]|uniref:glycosyltransferase family 2 protein n=1 Tax=Kitasatospora sp. NPDC057198 TaxID=3346046 RepID=UPI003627B798